MEPLANGVHAVRLAPRGAERTVVIGAGTIGLVTLQAALLDGHAERGGRRAATRRGARGRVALGRERSTEAEPGEADLVLDAVGARGDARGSGWSCCAPAGRWSASGSPSDDTTLGFHGVVRSQHRIQGSYAYTMPDFEQAHEWLVSGAGERSATTSTAVRPLEDGPEQFARLAGRPAAARVQGLPRGHRVVT